MPTHFCLIVTTVGTGAWEYLVEIEVGNIQDLKEVRPGALPPHSPAAKPATTRAVAPHVRQPARTVQIATPESQTSPGPSFAPALSDPAILSVGKRPGGDHRKPSDEAPARRNTRDAS